MTSKLLSQAIGLSGTTGNSTNITLSSNGSLQLAANGGTDIFISSNDNIGFGNTTPADKLSIQGSLYTSSNTVTFGAAGKIDANGNFGLGVTPSGWQPSISVFQIGSQGYMKFGGGTNLNIGVNQYFYNGYKFIANGYATEYSQDSGNHYWYSTATSGTAGTNTNITNTMVLTKDGNLGIGNSSPSYRLDVQGMARLGYNVAQGSPSSSDVSSTAHTLLSGTGGNYLAFGQYGSSGSYAQWIQSTYIYPSTQLYHLVLQPLGGYVGIGNTPSVKFDVHGASGYVVSRVNATDGSLTRFQLQNTNRNWSLSNYGSQVSPNGSLVFADETAGLARLSIDTSGRTIIGPSTTATTQLEVYNSATSGHLTLSADDAGASDQSRIDLDFLIKSSGHRIARIASRYITSAGTGEGELRFFTKTESTALTQQMKITGDGQLVVGANGGVNAGKIHSYGPSGYQAYTAQVGANVYSLFQGFSSSGVMSFQVQGDGTTAITGGVSGQGMKLGRDGATGGGYIQAEYSGTGTLSFNTSGTTRLKIEADGTIKTTGALNVSAGGYSKRSFTASGNYTASTWYEICNSSNLTEEGIYIIRGYASTYSAGGGFYDWRLTSVPFNWFVGGTNSTNAFTFPAPLGSGHADNGSTISFRIRQTSGSTDGKSYVDFQSSNSLSGMSGGTFGKWIYFDFIRIA